MVLVLAVVVHIDGDHLILRMMMVVVVKLLMLAAMITVVSVVR